MRLPCASFLRALLLIAAILNPASWLVTAVFARIGGDGCRPFPDNQLYVPGSGVLGIGAGDFNRDGLVDMVVNLSFGVRGGLGFLAGTPGGKFGGVRIFDDGNASGGLVVGDFNNDKRLDVAVGSWTGSVNVLLGNGDGTFQPPRISIAQTYIHPVVAGDFNDDGRLDVAVLSPGLSTIQVLLGRGDGTFDAPLNYLVHDEPYGMAAADFNGDHRLDLVVSNLGVSDSVVSVLLGKGDGTFQPKVDYQVGIQPYGVTAADLNDDGKSDLATANYNDGTVSVLLNKGDGTFREQATYHASLPGGLDNVVALRFEQGDRVGLAVTGAAGTYILVNKGDGTFRRAKGYNPASSLPTVADLNGDGRADLAVGTHNYDTGYGLAILFGKGDGYFASSDAHAWKPDIDAVGAGDFNHDGKPDLAVGRAGVVGIMLGKGQGRFSPVEDHYSTPGHPTGIVVGDLNRDGNLDLALLLSQYRNEVYVLLGQGNGKFVPGGDYPVLGELPDSIALGDLNRDGILDVVASSRGEYYSTGAVSVFLGNGDGTFQGAVGYAQDGRPDNLVLSDFNGDRNPDFAVADFSRNSIEIFLGNGDGTFRDGIETQLPSSPIALAGADFDGDGRQDLAVAINFENIQTLYGNGDGTFRRGPQLPGRYGRLVAADFNRDGKPDLVALDGNDMVRFLPGRGDGSFRLGKTSYEGNAPNPFNPFTLADLNHDGAVDLLLPARTGTVTVLLNHCPFH